MRRFLACCAAVVFAGCSCPVGLAQSGQASLLDGAVLCLSAKQFLRATSAPGLTFGYFLDEKSNAGQKMLYVVEFAGPPRMDGYVFTVFVTQSSGIQNFNIQNNGRFKLSKNGDHGVEFIEPPLGGTWAQEHLISAIRRIEKGPKRAIAAKSLLTTDSSITCEAYTDPQPASH